MSVYGRLHGFLRIMVMDSRESRQVPDIYGCDGFSILRCFGRQGKETAV